MLNYLHKIWEEIKTSYWFLPSLMCLLAIVLAQAMASPSLWLNSHPFQELGWMYQSTADSARSILGTIASSIITVAGVTFSITIVSVVHASSQFGPRLLSNFMSDRGNQFTLGMFISTFVYCILMMQRIDDPIVSNGRALPDLGIAFAVLLAIINMATLIYFIHHVAASLLSSNIVDNIGRQLTERIRQQYPPGRSQTVSSTMLALEGSAWMAESIRAGQQVQSRNSGYLQFVDMDALVAFARQGQGVLALNHLPGDFVSDGDCLVWSVDVPFSEGDCEQIRRAFIIGSRRTAAQDTMFLANELVEVAARALSPGTTDPITAMQCMDWLGTAMTELSRRSIAESVRKDDEGRVRLIVNVKDFKRILNETLDVLRTYVLTDRNATLHFQKVIGRLLIRVEDTALHPVLLDKATLLKEQCGEYLTRYDVDLVAERHQVIEQIAEERQAMPRIMLQNRWLASSDG